MTMLTETQSSRITLLDRITALATAIGDIRRKRITVLELDALDEHVLRDIGLTRADMFDARTGPLSSDPVAVLRRARLRILG
jgi:uncharacterized protein YjiS (DUF1127 family)